MMYVKKSRLTAIFLIFAMLLTGCGQTQAEEPKETMIVYQALPLPDLFLEIPEGYETVSSEFYEEYYIKDDASIILTEDTSQTTYPDSYAYAIDALTQYKNMADTLTVRSSEVIDGERFPLQTLEFDYTIGDNPPLTCLVGYLTDGLRMFIITCKSQTETFESHRAEFLHAIQSARISK